MIQIGSSSVALRIANLAREGRLTVQGLALILLSDHLPRTACEVMEVARLIGITPILDVAQRRHVGTWTYDTRRRVVGPTTAYYAGDQFDV